MAATTITKATINATAPGVASAEEIRAAFTEHREELAWRAEVLTGDEVVAAACIIDARTPAEREGNVFQEWHWTSAREAAIRSALDMQRAQIGRLSCAYDRYDCIHVEQKALPLEVLEFMVKESNSIRLRLDSFCRFVLVLCGLENCRSWQVAQLLGISEHAVEAAYCATIQSLDVMRSQAIIDSYGYAAASN